MQSLHNWVFFSNMHLAVCVKSQAKFDVYSLLFQSRRAACSVGVVMMNHSFRKEYDKKQSEIYYWSSLLKIENWTTIKPVKRYKAYWPFLSFCPLPTYFLFICGDVWPFTLWTYVNSVKQNGIPFRLNHEHMNNLLQN